MEKTIKDVVVAVTLGVFLASFGSSAAIAQELDPAQVRAAAVEIGLDSLANVPAPKVENLGEFVNPGLAAQMAGIVLGKALFWDMQVGSDGQACASCHFHAGADSRAKNQLSPGLRNTPEPDDEFGNPVAGGVGFPEFGPNYELVEEDFPFHLLADAEESNFNLREVLRDTNDVCSSQGVFKALFDGTIPGEPFDLGTAVEEDIFEVDDVNVRRVEPRNTPTIINAVFNFDNFWDGRARNQFNGVSPLGFLDENATILVNERGKLLEKAVIIPNSSLASQAVGPPLSIDEMSFIDRTFPELGKKMLGLRPLGLQLVHRYDGVLSPFSRERQGLPGLTFRSYASLIRAAFQSKYWNSKMIISFDQDGKRIISHPFWGVDGFSQMEANFSLFFGLAIQMYEATLVSDQTRFDKFMEGDDGALTQDELRGLLTFINRGRDFQVANPLFSGVSQGNCVSCHGGAEFTDASFRNVEEEAIEVEETPELDAGELIVAEETGFIDNGFSNIGVRTTPEDLGRGAEELGKPLSFIRQALEGFPFAPELPECGVPGAEDCPPGFPDDPKVQVDGAFKIPGLRNVELTGPYFHNGGEALLGDVVEFYDRRSNFGDVNIEELDRNMARVELGEGDEDLLVEFLLTLTDERVRNEMAPFDHPQIFVPNGHPGDQDIIECIENVDGVNQACDDLLDVEAVGAFGRPAEGLPPLEAFLGLDHLGE
ncbi:cytochrome C peroxidase [Candidatus Poribacteria bacterium]|nr:cytochrome C peroxidase [Candidatus Poribacteria bacterium]